MPIKRKKTNKKNKISHEERVKGIENACCCFWQFEREVGAVP